MLFIYIFLIIYSIIKTNILVLKSYIIKFNILYINKLKK